MARKSLTQAGRVADAALALAIVAAPVAGGSAHPTMLPVLSAIVLVAWLATVTSAAAHGRLGVPGVAIGLALFALVTAAQLVPLPHGLLEVLSPRAAALRDFVGDGLAYRPITYEPAATAREAAKLLLLALVAHVAHARASAHGRIDRVAGAVVIAGLASGLVALVHRALDAERMLGVLPSARIPSRLVTTFVNPNHAAGFMVMASLTAAGLALAAKRRGPTIGWFVAAGVLAFLSVLGFSRGGLVAMMVGVALLLGRAARSRAARSPIVLVASGVSLATVAAVFWKLDGVLRDFSGAPSDPLGISAKLAAMKDAWPMIGEHPWTGIGRGAYVSVYPAYKTYTYQYTFTHPENFVVEALSDWGVLVGSVALLALGVTLVNRVLSGRSLATVGAMSGVVAVLVQNLVDFSLELPGVALPCAALVGAAGAGIVRSRKVALPRMTAVAVAVGVAAVMIGSVALSRDLGSLEADLASMPAGRASVADVSAIAARHPANAIIAARLSYYAETAAPESRDLSVALQWINRAMYLAPTYADAHLGAGRILIALDYRQQGFGELRRAWALVSNSARVLDIIGEIIRLARTPAELIRAMPRADDALDVIDMRELPRLLRKLQLVGRPELGRAVLHELGTTLETAAPLHLLSIADEARRLGELDVARALLERRSEAMPGDARTELAMVEVMTQAGALDDAQARLDRAIASATGDVLPTLHRRAFELALQRRDLDRGREALERFRASMAPTDLNQLVAYQLEARVETRAGRLTHALDALDNAVRLAPAQTSVRLDRARTALSAHRPREARRDVDAVLRTDPQNADALRLRGTIEAQDTAPKAPE